MACRKIGEIDSSIYFFFFQVIAVLSLASVVIWLSLIPRNPSFTIVNLHFPSKNSSAGSGNSSIILFDFKISNPNKGISIYYDGIFLNLYYKGVIVGTNSTPPFYQGHKNKTSWKIPVNAPSAVADPHFQQGLRGGKVDIQVGVETSVKFKIFRWKTKAHRIGCEAHLTSMNISPNGSTLSGGNDIKLHQLLKPGSKVRN